MFVPQPYSDKPKHVQLLWLDLKLVKHWIDVKIEEKHGFHVVVGKPTPNVSSYLFIIKFPNSLSLLFFFSLFVYLFWTLTRINSSYSIQFSKVTCFHFWLVIQDKEQFVVPILASETLSMEKYLFLHSIMNFLAV